MARIARGSIRRQVPALVGVVLGLGVLMFGAIAYQAVRRSTLAAADQRLGDIAGEFASAMGEDIAEMLDSASAVAGDPAIVAAAAALERFDTADARASLERLGPVEGDLRAVELRRTGGVILALGDSSPVADRAPGWARAPEEGGVGLLYGVRDTAMLEVRMPVARDDDIVAHVVQVRHIAGSAEAVNRLSQLLGADAALLLMNADGSFTTDLLQPVSLAPLPEGPSEYDREGVTRRASAARIEGTSLLIAAEFPEVAVLAPVRPLLWLFAGLGGLVVGAGTLAGWLFSRRMTLPLVRLAGAAGEITAGDLDVTVGQVHRDDEIGDLAKAFNVMTVSVRRARDSLEDQVARRTAELERALDELREVQDELVKKERLATLGELSGSVGHELRNPLGVMTNAVYYLEHVLTDPPAKVTEYLGLLRDHIHISEKIVSDLLDFARVRPPQKQRVTVERLLDEQLGRVSIPDGVAVERRIPEGTPAVLVDPGQIGQVVLNLLTNGVQAMEGDRGVLTLEASWVDSVVRLEVGDTGPGVPGEHRHEIFEPLFTTKARGIGLGLSVSRSLAQANGGDLRLAEGPADGATFVLELPSAGGSK